MSVVIKTGFQRVTHDIIFQPKTEPKGKDLVKAGHVCNVEEQRINGVSFLIQAQVIRQTSVTLPPYSTKLHINALRKITSVSCNCVYNQSARCKHIAALIHYVNNEDSLTKTDFEQQWGRPTARQFALEKYSKGKYFFEMYPEKQNSSLKWHKLNAADVTSPSSLRAIVLEEKKNKHQKMISNLMESMLKEVDAILEKEECARCLNICFIMCESKPIYSTSQRIPFDLYEFYTNKIVMSKQELTKLCCDTLEQSKCAAWFSARILRVSASKNAHSIKSRKTKSVEGLIAEMLNSKKIDTPALRYGKKHEDDALNEYRKLYGNEVRKIGLIVSEKQPWVCASPDGIVLDNTKNIIKIVEFKCPITCQKQKVDLEAKKCNVGYLTFEDHRVKLRMSSVYYTQCQIQMYVTGLEICDLFIYSQVKDGSFCVEIQRNESFLQEVVNKCEHFYFQCYLSELCKKVLQKQSHKNVLSDISNQIHLPK